MHDQRFLDPATMTSVSRIVTPVMDFVGLRLVVTTQVVVLGAAGVDDPVERVGRGQLLGLVRGLHGEQGVD
ncbi:hypothetical protein V5P93_005682 [Actinokineospora auranticolor]|uniref:hypothetical protein n=1 Tax=Actinokineospora auranticolor TaxID=155976 RepID=UPI000CEC0FA1|nr:hypothetical protein [Actinokineospora auranticolor]